MRKVVIVEWVDSCSCDRWQYIEDLKDYTFLNVVSVGQVIKEDDKSIVLGLNVVEEKDAQVSGVMAIPKAAIKSLRELCVGDDEKEVLRKQWLDIR